MRDDSSRGPSARFGAVFADRLAEVVDLSHGAAALDSGGWWVLAGTFEGTLTGYRFARVRRWRPPRHPPRWIGPAADQWCSSIDAAGYHAGVTEIRARIARGLVYQVNLCRLLSAPLPAQADPWALAALLERGNPAPYAGVLDLRGTGLSPGHGGTHQDWIVSASPELFLGRDSSTVWSSPIKGTAPAEDSFADKDFPENVMITDLVRNDLGRVARSGSVVVTSLLSRENHPGLSHLVSTVRAELADGRGWTDLLAATFPPGSVSGAPKLTALQAIRDLEPTPRGIYCGAFGFVDADRDQASLAVAIRTFTAADGRLSFGTGAGITWASDPLGEWRETELKAARLVALASGTASADTAAAWSGSATASPGTYDSSHER